jgi:hypothetical protein
MATMVFGEWRGDGMTQKRDIMHFATAHNPETGYTVACGLPRRTFRMRVYSGFAASPERRLEQGERATDCKNCRRKMGWATPTDQRNKR